MRAIFALMLALLMVLSAPCAGAEPLDQPGYACEGGTLAIVLEENPSTGYEWSIELDGEAVLTLTTEESLSENADAAGEDGLKRLTFEAAGDGEAVLFLYYERAWEDESPAQTLCYTVQVQQGEIIDCVFEDLTGWGEEQGDDEAGVRYDGDTGGVAVYLPAGLTEQPQQENARRFESEDGSTWVCVEYDPDEDAQALLDEFSDEDAVRAVYDDPETGSELISCSVDREAEVPYALVVYSLAEEGGLTIVDSTCYAAPEGGVTYVQNGYFVAF